MSKQSTNRHTDPFLITLTLLIILSLAAYLRFIGLDWDENHHLHPDERFLTQVVSTIQPVDSLQAYFDTRHSTLNPNNVGFGFFVYGDFPIIFTRYVAEWVGKTDYFTVYLVGRIIAASSDLLSVLLIFYTARHLFDPRVGLLAAALYAFSALPIQLSHFFTVDVFTNMLVAATFFFIARSLTHHNWIDYPLFGLLLGLAMASKVSVFPLAIILAIALALRVAREVEQRQQTHLDRLIQLARTGQDNQPARPPWWRHPAAWPIARALIGLCIAGLLTVIAFRVGQPYAFLPPGTDEPIQVDQIGLPMALISRLGEPLGLRPNPLWLAQMNEVKRQVSGFADIPPNHQWGKRLPLIFPWVNMVRVGFGWPLGVFCWLAFAWSLWEIGRGHRGATHLMPLATWVALMFVWQGVGWVKTMRYFLPIYPFLTMLAAWALITLWDRIQTLLTARRAPRWHWSAIFSAALAIVVLISAFAWGFAVSRIYTRPVTRVAASRWILENVPSDLTFSFETAQGPRQYQLGLPNNWPSREQPAESPTQPAVKVSFIAPDLATMPYPFTLPFDGTLTHIRLNHVLDPEGRQGQETLTLILTGDLAGTNVLATGSVVSDFEAGDDPRGDSYDVPIQPVFLSADTTYYLILKPTAPLLLSGSSLAVEGAWDDPVPLSIAPYNVWGAQYQGYELEMAWEDTEEKRARLIYILDRADYLTISSNRFYAAMPRNPQRYPLTIAYYQALFSGELGFELIGDFTSRPNLGPIEFFDDNAEEAWTVYDHPRVFIFRKRPDYDPARVAAILGSVDLEHTVRAIAKDAKGRPVNIPLPRLHASPQNPINSASDPQTYTPRPSFFVRFQPLTVVLWWLLITVIGWLAFPILYTLFPGLPDRAYPLARTFGMLSVAWLAWFAASSGIPSWSTAGVLIAMLILGLVGIALILPQRRSFLDWLRANRRHILLAEGLFAALFLLFLLIRLGNPDLWHPAYGGEKPMDLAYFNAVLRSGTFPPYDPWFAGGTINYYYFGFVIVGAPLKVLPIPPTLAYNLILPTLFALTGLGAFSSAYNLVAPSPNENEGQVSSAPPRPSPTLWETLRAWPRPSALDVLDALGGEVEYLTLQLAGRWRSYAAGLAAILLSILLGNLDQIRTILWGLAELGAGSPSHTNTPLPDLSDVLRGLTLSLGQGQPLPVGLGEWYWNATRLIPVPIENNIPTEVGPITEFPFFTFLYADLHAHMIAMSLALLALIWGIAQVRSAALTAKKKTVPLLLNLLAGALIVGSLWPTNSWDLPTYLLLASATIGLAHLLRRQDMAALPALGAGALLALMLGGLVYLFGVTSTAGAPSASRLVLLAAGTAALIGLLTGFAIGLAFTPPPGDEGQDKLYRWLTLLGILTQVAGLAGAAVLFYLPYIQHYQLGYSGFTLWTGSHTPLWAYCDILGLPLFLIVSWLVWESWCWASKAAGRLRRSRLLPLILGLAAYGALTWYVAAHGIAVAWAVLPLGLWTVVLFLRPDQPTGKRLALIMLLIALALALMVELLVLQGDIGRMNTVFKFYTQIWLLMAIVAGAALAWLWPALTRAPRLIRTPWSIALAILFLLAALYPVLATRAKVADRWAPDAPLTLDGMAYMPYVQAYANGQAFSLLPDYVALRWLQDNVRGTPVVLEAQTVEYQWGSRVSIYTGLPAVIGWNWHQRQQRPFQSDEVWQRVGAVQQAYNATDIQITRDILNRYNVDLIIVGELERAYYNLQGLAKFQTMLELGYLRLIYDQHNTLIYQVVKR